MVSEPLHRVDCVHTHHEDGTHELLFQMSSALAVKQAEQALDGIFSAAPSGERIQVLLNASISGPLPMKHVTIGLNHLIRAHGREKLKSLHIAFVYRELVFLPLLLNLLRSFRTGMTLNRFYMDDYEAARAWLRGEPDDTG